MRKEPDTLHIILFGMVLMFAMLTYKYGQRSQEAIESNNNLREELTFERHYCDSLDSAHFSQFRRILYDDSIRTFKHRK